MRILPKKTKKHKQGPETRELEKNNKDRTISIVENGAVASKLHVIEATVIGNVSAKIRGGLRGVGCPCGNATLHQMGINPRKIGGGGKAQI